MAGRCLAVPEAGIRPDNGDKPSNSLPELRF